MQANDTVWVVVQWWPRDDFPPLIEVFGQRTLAEYDTKRKRDQEPESRVIMQEASVRQW
ncbi:hypothetical protein TC41_1872 [Alicyclobacillus acidocaldarius subsp. acidocaldarius Tc-4-1]|uniref:Uncharacterized protein n=1 Tax=Alicyclobacillus acidocaldarius (strain Tc-4-1) TaxID=1048834 RepID=F8IDD6_ALIAT|nr:hypothetical protein TC41_1872 [Alicyclobacillus acidocaldarius subsp. acidocaldarius Tc-4-1]